MKSGTPSPSLSDGIDMVVVLGTEVEVTGTVVVVLPPVVVVDGTVVVAGL